MKKIIFGAQIWANGAQTWSNGGPNLCQWAQVGPNGAQIWAQWGPNWAHCCRRFLRVALTDLQEFLIVSLRVL